MILFLWGKLPRSGPVDRGNSVIIVPHSQIWEASCLFSGGVKNIQPGSKDSNGSAAVPDCFLVGNSFDAPGSPLTTVNHARFRSRVMDWVTDLP